MQLEVRVLFLEIDALGCWTTVKTISITALKPVFPNPGSQALMPCMF